MTAIGIPAGIDPGEWDTWTEPHQRRVRAAGGHLIQLVADSASDIPQIRYDCSCGWDVDASNEPRGILKMELGRLRHLTETGRLIQAVKDVTWMAQAMNRLIRDVEGRRQ
jgi:hypothetical protein